MRRLVGIVALLAFAGAGAAAAEKRPSKDGKRTLHGLYTSGFQSGPQRLRAVFEPSGENAWEVEFHFRWSGDDRVYVGAAQGTLSEGTLHGRVRNEDGTRVFTFRCEFDKKKRCKGTHAEIVPTGEHETGTITLKES